ncbi:unnamed protein product [Closterium sp. NIES-64]|nr:unnamed protein product [Closterium sp. NIES-64]
MAHGCFLHSSVIVSAAPSPGTLGGTVRLIFQPAEEGGAGGKRMVDGGALKGASAAFALHVSPKVGRWKRMVDGGALKGASAAFALHVSPKIPAGYVGSRPGMLLAGSGRFNATVWGKGGHAAMPQFAADPILAAAHIVSSLQAIVSRETDPFASRVISVTQFHGGSADNVIPDTVTLRGTYRATTKDGLADLERRIADIIDTQARVFGCRGEVDYGMMDANLQADAGADGGGGDEATKAAESESEGFCTNTAGNTAQGSCTAKISGEPSSEPLSEPLADPLGYAWPPKRIPAYPPTVNDVSMHALGRDVVQKLLGSSAYLDVDPWMAGEDFSFYQEAVPGAIEAKIKRCSGMEQTGAALPTGVALHVVFVQQYLSQGRAEA